MEKNIITKKEDEVIKLLLKYDKNFFDNILKKYNTFIEKKRKSISYTYVIDKKLDNNLDLEYDSLNLYISNDKKYLINFFEVLLNELIEIEEYRKCAEIKKILDNLKDN